MAVEIIFVRDILFVLVYTEIMIFVFRDFLLSRKKMTDKIEEPTGLTKSKGKQV